MDMMNSRTFTIAPNGEPFVALCPICGKIVPLPHNIAFNVMIPDSTHVRGAYYIVPNKHNIMTNIIYTPACNYGETPMFNVTCEDCKLSMFVIENEFIAKLGRALFMGLHLNVLEITKHGILIEALPTDFNTEIVRDLLGTFFDVHEPNKKYRDLRFRSKNWCDAFIDFVDVYFIHPERYARHSWSYLSHDVNIDAVIDPNFLDQLKKAVEMLEMRNSTILHYMYRRTIEGMQADLRCLHGVISARIPNKSSD